MTTPSVEALMRTFLDHEEAAGLWDLQARGLAYWPRIRFLVFQSALLATGAQARAHGGMSDRPLWDRWRPHPRRWPSTIRRNRWRDLSSAELLVLPHPRYVLDGDGWRCPYSSPLVAGSGYSHWIFKDVYQGEHVGPILEDRVKYLEWHKRLAKVRYVIRDGWRRRWLTRADRRRIAELGAGLRAALGAGPDDARLVAMIHDAQLHEFALGRLYDQLLDRVRPKAVIMVVYYGRNSLPMLSAARRHGVPVIELQHGFIGPAHAAYNLHPDRSSALLPDYLLTFGDYWRESVPQFAFPPERAVPIGNGWLDAHRTATRGERRDPRRSVLVISQGTVAPELAQISVRLAERLGTERFVVRFKHHPSDRFGWRERYPELVGSKVEVIDQPTDIYEEFSRSDVLVGVNSTAMFEGLPFGLKTCVLALAGHRAMLPLVERGIVTLCPDADALADELLAEAPAPPPNTDEIWRPGAAANFRRFMTDLIGPPLPELKNSPG